MMELILMTALQDTRIRAVIMNDSRTSPSASKDIFQGFDIVYVITDVESFVDDSRWIDQFGERLIMQKPDEMDGKWAHDKHACARLV